MYMTGLNKMCSFAWNIGLLPLIVDRLKKLTPTLWRFGDNPLRIDWDIDENVQFCLKYRVATPCCDRLEKLTLLCEGLKVIH